MLHSQVNLIRYCAFLLIGRPQNVAHSLLMIVILFIE